MTDLTPAIRIRDAIVARLLPLADTLGIAVVPGEPRIRTTPVPQLQDDELPGLLVVIMDEADRPDGDANHGPPAFYSEITIGISLVANAGAPAAQDAAMEANARRIKRTLLTDPSFVRHWADPANEPLFEAVERISTRRLWPQDGATYLSELRMEWVFSHREQWDPVVPDELLDVEIQGAPAPAAPGTPRAGARVTFPPF